VEGWVFWGLCHFEGGWIARCSVVDGRWRWWSNGVRFCDMQYERSELYITRYIEESRHKNRRVVYWSNK
jgi:hypothetical protein